MAEPVPNKAIGLNPKYVEAFNNRGNARFDIGDKKGSIQDYNIVIELDSNYALAYSNRGNARADLGDKKGAIEDYNKLLKIYQKSWTTEKAAACFRQSQKTSAVITKLNLILLCLL
ncbi:MAG: tetratricopeptide repeat protein [Pseudanabaena sp. CRU_2_10]|nr:tetratricopeptide repeat protein [Pseudanabaena sp. CRU_2_10]